MPSQNSERTAQTDTVYTYSCTYTPLAAYETQVGLSGFSLEGLGATCFDGLSSAECLPGIFLLYYCEYTTWLNTKQKLEAMPPDKQD